MVRQTVFGTLMLGIRTTAMGFYNKVEIEFKSEYGVCNWEIIAKGQSRESVNGKLPRGKQT